ncbi:hypothetical protein RintRC_5405 [Richelia intracellularis]|nr:hypothetical protein RintRC_5405 [Richelia intracellularis]
MVSNPNSSRTYATPVIDVYLLGSNLHNSPKAPPSLVE